MVDGCEAPDTSYFHYVSGEKLQTGPPRNENYNLDLHICKGALGKESERRSSPPSTFASRSTARCWNPACRTTAGDAPLGVESRCAGRPGLWQHRRGIPTALKFGGMAAHAADKPAGEELLGRGRLHQRDGDTGIRDLGMPPRQPRSKGWRHNSGKPDR
jgi:hypothetical protein